jgi:hypothetical protein
MSLKSICIEINKVSCLQDDGLEESGKSTFWNLAQRF